MIIFISGLPGAGKSTVGALVAKQFDWKFVETDVFLSEEMKVQIKKGELLSPKQLDEWVINGFIPGLVKLEKTEPVVASGMLAEDKYVEILNSQSISTLYINLEVPYSILKERVNSRDHFAGEEMLNKCYKLKEKFVLPGSTINGNQPLEKVVNDVVEAAKIHFSI